MSDAKHASVVVEPLEPWALSPKQTAIVENCGLSVVYERLANGEYDAFKRRHAHQDYGGINQAAAGQPAARNIQAVHPAGQATPRQRHHHHYRHLTNENAAPAIRAAFAFRDRPSSPATAKRFRTHAIYPRNQTPTSHRHLSSAMPQRALRGQARATHRSAARVLLPRVLRELPP